MASCKCGGAQCNCVITAGANTTVTGAGSTGNPYVIDATAPPANVITGCGLTGTGAAASPLAVNGQPWPFACDIAANGSGVYCDPATGELHADPAYWADFQGNQENTALGTPMVVPSGPSVVVDSISVDVTNPDQCRRAIGLLFREIDLEFTLPPNSGASAGIDGDDMSYLGNQGSGTIISTHVQTNKLSVFTLNPGETRTITMQVNLSRGTGGATLTRIQKSIRAWSWSNNFN
jgi:hypothetical protein